MQFVNIEEQVAQLNAKLDELGYHICQIEERLVAAMRELQTELLRDLRPPKSD